MAASYVSALAIALFAVGFSTMAFAQQQQPATVLFRASFDQGLAAEKSGGAAEPTNTDRRPTTVPGRRGNAVRFEQGQVLRYENKGSINKTRGSLAVWVQAPFDGMGPLDEPWRTILKEDGPNDIGSGGLWFWFHPGSNMRFDVRDPDDRYLNFPMFTDWKKGEWHFVVVNWDNTRGTEAYLDGRYATISGGDSGRPTSWKPIDFDAFFLGAFSATGEQAWQGAIDEVTFYDRPLSTQEVGELYASYAGPVRVTIPDPYVTAGRQENVRVSFDSLTNKPASDVAVSYRLADAQGNLAAEATLPPLSWTAGGAKFVDIPVTVPAGANVLTVKLTGDDNTVEQKSNVWAIANAPAAKNGEQKRIRVTEADSTALTKVIQQGESHVVDSPLGKYREAGSKAHDRFAIPFEINAPGEPHVAVIRYPDDKPRTMEMILQSLDKGNDYQGQIGVLTGREFAITHQMREMRITFWPRDRRQAFIFMTYEAGLPAAIADLNIYRIEGGLTQANMAGYTGAIPQRRIGMYFEDPVLRLSVGARQEFPEFEKAVDRMLDYMQMAGQNTLHYPVIWYGGALYGSHVEPIDANLGERPHPPGFPKYLLKRLHARGMTFDGGIHLHHLQSLRPYEVADKSRVAAGEETVFNVMNDGNVKSQTWHGQDTRYNPLDPRVQKAIKDLVAEFAERYGDEPALTGMTFAIASAKMGNFSSLKCGYNDSNLRAFQKDTGITIEPYQEKDAERFAKSYQWLMANEQAKQAWIDWRCRKLHDFYKEVADVLTKKRADLTLTLYVFVDMERGNEVQRLCDYLHDGQRDLFREKGFDWSLFAGDKNIVLNTGQVPADYRWFLAHQPWKPGTEDNRTRFTAPEIVAPFFRHARSTATIHDRYWEDSIGGKSPLKDLGSPELGWRVTTLNGTDFNAMEPFVTALNNLDAFQIVKGGFVIGTYGWENHLASFARAYRALPAVRFEDVEAASDPVRVRQAVVDGKRYVYVLNRLPEPVKFTLTLSGNATIRNLVTNINVEAKPSTELALAPYELQSFVIDGATVQVTSGRGEVSESLRTSLQKDLDDLHQRFGARKDKPEAQAIAPYLAYADEASKGGHYARLRLLLQESWAERLRRDK